MPQGKQLELQRQHHPLAIRYAPHIKLAQRPQPRRRVRAAFHNGPQAPQTVAGFLLEQREEQVFFAVEVSVESAARVAGGPRDILNP